MILARGQDPDGATSIIVGINFADIKSLLEDGYISLSLADIGGTGRVLLFAAKDDAALEANLSRASTLEDPEI